MYRISQASIQRITKCDETMRIILGFEEEEIQDPSHQRECQWDSKE